MRPISIIFLIFLALAYQVSWSIVPNTEYYAQAEARIKEIDSSIQQLNASLSINPKNETELALKANLEQEKKLIIERVKLYQKLEQEHLIMYSKENTK